MENYRVTHNALNDVCNYICNNCLELKAEFQQVNSLLADAETLGVSYLRKDMIEFHFKNELKEYNLFAIDILSSKIKQINEEANNEFFQGLDIANIHYALLKEVSQSNILAFVWKAKKKLQYIAYGIDRIAEANDANKKIAILKGMLAYY